MLSGYLITDLLAAQWNRHGHLDLRGFWARRARRLLPALAVLLVVVTAAIEHRTSLLWPDEVHPQPSGARLYARMVTAVARAARAAGAAGPARAPGCRRPRTASRLSAD